MDIITTTNDARTAYKLTLRMLGTLRTGQAGFLVGHMRTIKALESRGLAEHAVGQFYQLTDTGRMIVNLPEN